MYVVRILGAVVVAGALLGGMTPPSALAAPLVGCEHREAGHVDKHGGQLEDDRFHRAHGERVTCSDDKPDKHDDGDGKADSSRDGSSDPTRRHSDDKKHDDDKHGDGHTCIGRCNRDHSLWH